MRKLFARVLWQILLLADVAINRLFNGRTELISARAGRARDSGRLWGCYLCRFLDWIDHDHCNKAKADPLGELD